MEVEAKLVSDSLGIGRHEECALGLRRNRLRGALVVGEVAWALVELRLHEERISKQATTAHSRMIRHPLGCADRRSWSTRSMGGRVAFGSYS
jgi:hypothetical protein